MAKIVIIGAGSGFGSRLSIDILSRPLLRDATIALCDTDPGRLAQVRDYVERAIAGHNLPAQCIADTDRDKLLPGADFVVAAVSVGGPAYWGEPYAFEIGIPLEYGVHQTVADTVGVGGVFRFLRTAHEHLAFCRSMEAHCPDALMLNYTNPMAMLIWAHSVGSSIANVGLCHSVQGTTKKLADAIGAPYGEVDYLVAGINHQAWILKFARGGRDLYPQIFEAVDSHDSFRDDRVRVEMMRQFGYFVTESTRHNSEYLPYFRRTGDLRQHYGVPDREPVPMELPEARRRAWMRDTGVDEDDPEAAVPPLQPSHEYASAIVEAKLTGVPFVFNGNVMNKGAIANLPANCCVEVPCMVDRGGVHPCYVGALPPQCAALNNTNIAVQELAVKAFLERDREAAFHACALDPLTAATVSLPEIRQMFDELWEAEGDRLAYFAR